MRPGGRFPSREGGERPNRDFRPQTNDRPWFNKEPRGERPGGRFPPREGSERPNRDFRPQTNDRPWFNKESHGERPTERFPSREGGERPGRDFRDQGKERPRFDRDSRPPRGDDSGRPDRFDRNSVRGEGAQPGRERLEWSKSVEFEPRNGTFSDRNEHASHRAGREPQREGTDGRERLEWSKSEAPPVIVPSPESIARGSEQKKKLKGSTPREAAISAYLRWLRAPTRIDATAERELSRSNWDKRDRGLFLELLYGVIRQHGRLGWLIKRLTTTRDEPDPAGIACVAVGLYQILYLDRVPEYAIVDSSVEVSKSLGGRPLASWVNALLRRASVDREILAEMWPDSEGQPLYEQLGQRYSHPSWMVGRWLDKMPREKVERFLEWNNRRPGLSLRVNRLKSSAEELIASLTEAGGEATVNGTSSDFVDLSHMGDPRDLEAISTGKATIQDASQGLIARLVNPVAGEEILDLCAAPGGKTGHMAEIAPGATIIATDKAEERLQLVRDLIVRNGYTNISVENYDDVVASKRKYDAVLVDAPCSGTGVLARRPDLRWRRSPDDIKRMASVQINLLNYAADRLKPKGRLIYSTCSVEAEENGGVIDRFLSERRDLVEMDASLLLPGIIKQSGGRLNLLGPEFGCDGVFAAVLERRG